MERKRIIYADILRILATFSVIILHVASDRWEDTPLNSMDWHVLNIYESIVHWCVPVFVMLSGMFFLDPVKKISTKDICFKYIARIFIALVFWGTIYSAYSYMNEMHISANRVDINIFKYIAFKILFGYPWFHLWFLYTIIGIYLLTPFLRKLLHRWGKKELEYFLLIFTVVGPFIPLLHPILSEMGKIFSISFKMIEVVGFLGYFAAGYYFSNYTISRSLKLMILSLAGVSLIITIIGTYFISVNTGKPSEFFYEYFSINTMIVAYAVFIMIKEKLNTFEFNYKTTRIIEYVSNCTFGIYLIHEIFDEIFKNYNIDSLSFNPIISVPLLAALNFLLSLLVIATIRKIPWFNKRII
jgi:surface polysaccharide O-acyltransferase-like enzyme